jgi:hypothetical protein
MMLLPVYLIGNEINIGMEKWKVAYIVVNKIVI